MNGVSNKLVQYMKGSSRFVIPVYQRNYEWSVSNCKELYDDLIKVVKNSLPSHFFGSIVSVCDSSGEEFLIIDGQQRLTTVSLLLLAICNLLNEGKVVSKTSSLAEQIYKQYLIDEYAEGQANRMKLKPVKGDAKAYEALFDENLPKTNTSSVMQNYQFFCKQILDCKAPDDANTDKITVDQLFDAIKKLEIIKITLSESDNPQLIFESLNSTGVALNEGDKIRNFILMGLDKKLQEDYYERYWRKIEENTGFTNTDLFVRDYLSVKYGRTPKFSDIYKEFKNYFTETDSVRLEDRLAEMLRYSKFYGILLNNSFGEQELDACIYRLNRLETTVARPFFMEVLKLHEENPQILSLSDMKEVFKVVETYYFRRNTCHVPTNALNKIFVTLHRDILRFDTTPDDYLEKMKYVLLSKRESGRLPNDADFMEAFATNQVYNAAPKAKTYLLERLENFGTLESKEVYDRIDDGTYTIEHIMPQTLSADWKNELGQNWQEIYDTWLHRVANLTLTAYNSKYSNKLFKVKKTVENGLSDSGLRMNHKIVAIAQNDTWGLRELEIRNEELKAQALKIWSLPVSTFKPKEKEQEYYTLDTETNLRGKELAKYTFLDELYESSDMSWVKMYCEVLSDLYILDETKLMKIANSNDLGYSSLISTDKSRLRVPEKVADGIFVEKNLSTTAKIGLLRKVFTDYGISEAELVFYLKDKKENAVEAIEE